MDAFRSGVKPKQLGVENVTFFTIDWGDGSVLGLLREFDKQNPRDTMDVNVYGKRLRRTKIIFYANHA